MKKNQLYKLIDLIEDIKKTDAMIKLHSNLDKSDFMVSQYQSKKDKLTSYLIQELVSPVVRSARSYFTIKLILEKFYPKLNIDSDPSKADIEDLFAIESAL